MGGQLHSFKDFLARAKILKDAARKNLAMQGLAEPFRDADYPSRLAHSWIIETRSEVVTGGEAEIFSIGKLVSDDEVLFKPAEALSSDIESQTFRLRGELKEFFGFSFDLPLSNSGIELLESLSAELLNRDPGFEDLQNRRGDDAMYGVWRVMCVAIHDQICRQQPLELESIGMFAPADFRFTVRFTPDPHLLNLISGHRAAKSDRIQSKRRVGPLPE